MIEMIRILAAEPASRRRLAALALIAAGSLVSAAGAQQTTLRLSLPDAVGRALGDNAAAQLATSEIARAESVAAQARSALLP